MAGTGASNCDETATSAGHSFVLTDWMDVLSQVCRADYGA